MIVGVALSLDDGPFREMLVSFLLYGKGLFGTLPCTSQVLFSNPLLRRVPISVVSVELFCLSTSPFA